MQISIYGWYVGMQRLTQRYPQGRLKPFKLDNSMLHHNVDCESHMFSISSTDTPYQGMDFINWPRYTLLRGKLMWSEGKLCGTPKDGQYLKRETSQFLANHPAPGKDPRRVADWLYEERDV